MSEEYTVKILKIDFVTHDVKRFILEKPSNYKFIPGQATDISINSENLKNEKRPFTFTSKINDPVLEFTIKKYSNGITEKIHNLKAGDELIIGETFGYFEYKGEGMFIAGGTGITPFLSMLRNMSNDEAKKNKLLFFNKAYKDIICERELTDILGENVLFLLTDEKRKGYLKKKLSSNLLKKEITDLNKYFYICGPQKFVKIVRKNLLKLGIDENKIIIEQ